MSCCDMSGPNRPLGEPLVPDMRELTGAAPLATGPTAGDRRWWLLAVVCVAQLMVILDATIVTIALPTCRLPP